MLLGGADDDNGGGTCCGISAATLGGMIALPFPLAFDLVEPTAAPAVPFDACCWSSCFLYQDDIDIFGFSPI